MKDYTKDKLFTLLDNREKNFLANFFGSKMGDYLIDFMNYQQDLKVYNFKHQRFLEVLGEVYLRNKE